MEPIILWSKFFGVVWYLAKDPTKIRWYSQSVDVQLNEDWNSFWVVEDSWVKNQILACKTRKHRCFNGKRTCCHPLPSTTTLRYSGDFLFVSFATWRKRDQWGRPLFAHIPFAGTFRQVLLSGSLVRFISRNERGGERREKPVAGRAQEPYRGTCSKARNSPLVQLCLRSVNFKCMVL